MFAERCIWFWSSCYQCITSAWLAKLQSVAPPCTHCLQAATPTDIRPLPSSHWPHQQTRDAQGQEASQEAPWACPSSANVAAPSSGAVLSSHRQPLMSSPPVLSRSDQIPTLHGRPGAPYLGRPAVHHSSRHTQFPGRAAADAVADRRQAAKQRRLDAQSSNRHRRGDDSAPAAEMPLGDRLFISERTTPQSESQGASVARLQAQAAGVIDLTLDRQSASPSLSAGSDCMVMGTSMCTQDRPVSASTLSVDIMELPGPSFDTAMFVDAPRLQAQSVSSESSAQAGAGAEPLQSSNAALQLPGGTNRHSAASSASAPVRPGGSDRGPPTDSPAQQLAAPKHAQAECVHRKRSRWDVMPEGFSPDSTSAPNPSASEAPANIHMQSPGFGAAQSAKAAVSELSGRLPAQAGKQQQSTGSLEDVSANSRPGVSGGAAQQEWQDGNRSIQSTRQLKKGSHAGSQHSQHRDCGYRHHSHRQHKSSRRRHSGRSQTRLAADDRQCRARSGTSYLQTCDQPVPYASEADEQHPGFHAQLHSQHQRSPEATERMHASQGDRWQMWCPQDV